MEKNKLTRILVACAVAAGLATSDPSVADGEWSQFRGPDRRGVSAETGLARTWPDGGPPVLWRRDLGDGYSGIAIVGERFYTLFADADKEYIGAFATADGAEVWRREIDDQVFSGDFGRGPRATPTVTEELVYGLSGRGVLVAVKPDSGEIRWQVDLFEKYGFFGPQWALAASPKGELQLPVWGYSYSPLVDGDLIFAETGSGEGKSYVAFDRLTGEERWTALDHPIGYGSPLAVTIQGRRHLITVADTDLVSMRLDGHLEWRMPWAPTIGQPLFLPPDKIFVSTVPLAHMEGGSMLVQVSGDGEAVSAEPLWHTQALKSLWSTPVAIDGHVYGFDNATLKCLSLADGEAVWAKRGLGKGTLIAADGLLFIYSDRGRVILAEASSEGYTEKGRVDVYDAARTWTPPSLADGRLYIRGANELTVFDVRGSR